MSIDTNGIFTWTPDQNQSPGTNLVTVVATNNDAFDTVNPTLTATNAFHGDRERSEHRAGVAGEFDADGRMNRLQLTVTNTATEPNIHATTTGYGLINPLPGMNITSNGLFTWTPSQSQSPGTNMVTVVVTE